MRVRLTALMAAAIALAVPGGVAESKAGSASKTYNELSSAVSRSSVNLELTLLRNDATCEPGSPTAAKIRKQYELFQRSIGSLENYFAHSLVRTGLPLTASFRLSVADKALKKQCLDIADDQYRQVMSIYTGSAYSALRDRAKIGIDDVRENERSEPLSIKNIPIHRVSRWSWSANGFRNRTILRTLS